MPSSVLFSCTSIRRLVRFAHVLRNQERNAGRENDSQKDAFNEKCIARLVGHHLWRIDDMYRRLNGFVLQSRPAIRYTATFQENTRQV